MNRVQRVERLIVHRRRAVDVAALALSRAQGHAQEAAGDVERAHGALVSARDGARGGTLTAADLLDANAFVRSLERRRELAREALRQARAAEEQARAGLLAARVAAEKLVVLRDNLLRSQAEEEQRTAQRQLDDRIGANAARRDGTPDAARGT